MGDHITEERLLEVSRGSGYEFSEEEVQHLTHCEECGRLLTVFLGITPGTSHTRR